MDFGFALISLLAAVACGAAGFFLLDRVDRGGFGALIGFLLGPIGLVIAWVVRDNALRDLDREEREHDRRHGRPDPALARRGFGSRAREEATAATARQQSTMDELERLASLRERGHLTEEEFERQKRQLLGAEAPGRRQRFR